MPRSKRNPRQILVSLDPADARRPKCRTKRYKMLIMRQISTRPTPNGTIRPLDHRQTVAHHLEVGQSQFLRHCQAMQKRHPLCIAIGTVAQIIADKSLPAHNHGHFNRAGVGATATVEKDFDPLAPRHVRSGIEHDNRPRNAFGNIAVEIKQVPHPEFHLSRHIHREMIAPDPRALQFLAG